jgi:predicted nucleic acid-binding protein
LEETSWPYPDYEVYLDTSALLRLYLEDEHSETVERLVGGAAKVYTSELTELEARVGLVRALHDKRLDEAEFEMVLEKLSSDFADGYDIVGYERVLSRRAGELARSEPGLRSYDALHLASAECSGALMMTYDRRLSAAAKNHGNYFELSDLER